MQPYQESDAESIGAPRALIRHALVVGASSGIGNALVLELLEQGFKVFGVGRTAPSNIPGNSLFHFTRIDLLDAAGIVPALQALLFSGTPVPHLDYVFLNAGRFSQRLAPMADIAMSDLTTLLQINVWGHKQILDELLARHVTIDTVIFSTSIAGVRARAGNSGYAISKAALNMMGKLYALENPAIFFSVLGMCNVDTLLSQAIGSLPLEGDFPDIVDLRARANAISGYVATANQRAKNVVQLLASDLKQKTASGDFVEIRSLL